MNSSLPSTSRRILIALVAYASSCVAIADQGVVTAQELLDKAAVRLSADAMRKTFAEGATVETVAPSSGNTRRWTHGADGTFTASSRGKMGTVSTAQGIWKVNDSGLYCVEIAWKTTGEQWCRAAYRIGSETYLAPVDLVKNADKQYGMVGVSTLTSGSSNAGAAPTISETAATAVGAAAAGTPSGASAATGGGRVYLTKPEVEQNFVGKSFVFKRGNEIIQWELRADGNLFGNNRTRNGRDAGSWQLADDGRLCIKWRGGSQDGCRYYYRSNEKFLMTETNQPGAVAVAEVQEIQ
jgi:hypothetical protein